MAVSAGGIVAWSDTVVVLPAVDVADPGMAATVVDVFALVDLQRESKQGDLTSFLVPHSPFPTAPVLFPSLTLALMPRQPSKVLSRLPLSSTPVPPLRHLAHG